MNKFNKNFQKAISVSYTLIGSILLFGAIGYFLSDKFQNELWQAGCLILGAVVGLYELYKQMNK